MPISAMMEMPIQKALKLPATSPDRMFSDAPPSLDDVSTSRTCAECIDVKIFTSSGMIAPASVPQLMMADSCHHRFVLPAISGISSFDARNVRPTETSEVIHTSHVSGCSKFIALALAYLPR